ncbi:histone-lysine N-methyltransferase SETMAR [Trichonephila clavipes]|nr:histone-lysine N-methyltransferase SETMAR [Trichonephila clavipes]
MYPPRTPTICEIFTSTNMRRYCDKITHHIRKSSEAKWTYRGELVRGCLLYDFKLGLSAAASSHRICQAFGDSAVNERMARHWFRKFRSGDMSLCDKARRGRPQALNDGEAPAGGY